MAGPRGAGDPPAPELGVPEFRRKQQVGSWLLGDRQTKTETTSSELLGATLELLTSLFDAVALSEAARLHRQIPSAS